MALKEGERFNVDTMAIEKIPAVVEQKAEAPKEEKAEEEPKEIEEPVEKEEPAEEKKESESTEELEEELEPETDEPENKEADAVDVNDFIKSEYSEKYEIKSKEDLDGVLNSIDNLMNRNKELELQLKEVKTEPQFKSEGQKKLWEFMQDIDPEKMGERLQAYSNLISVDTEKGDPKILLQEQYILQHPAWTREEAVMKFDRAYTRNYTAKRDDFDTDEEYKVELKSKELDMKDDVMKAKEFLKKQQETFKAKPKDEEKPTENIALKRAIEQTASEVDKYEFSELIFSPTDDKEDDFSVQLSDKQIKEIKTSLKAWVSNPNSYDQQKGELLGGWDVEQKSVMVAFMLFGPDIVEKNYQHALNLKNITRAEEIATRKPDRKAKTAGDNPSGQLSEEKQWEMAIKKKKANQNGRQMVYR